jgi:hypothetical protein
MSTTLTCPICLAQIGKNEALIVQHDAVGTLIVRHYIPADVEVKGDSHEMLRKRIGESSTEKLHFDATYGEPNTRHICGKAGFRNVVFNA